MQAMQIMLNEEALALETAEDTSVAQLLYAIESEHMPENHVVSTILINGMAWEHDHDEELHHLHATQINHLAVYTQTPSIVASEGLHDLQLMMGMIVQHVAEAIVNMRSNDIAGGVMIFLSGADMLRDVLYFMRLYLDHNDAEALDKARTDYKRITEALTQALMTFEGAQQKQDWTLVADLMEYEIKTRIDELITLGASLLQQEQTS